MVGAILLMNSNKKGFATTIIQQLQKNCEIDWYLQAELAYNKRFGESREEEPC